MRKLGETVLGFLPGYIVSQQDQSGPHQERLRIVEENGGAGLLEDIAGQIRNEGDGTAVVIENPKDFRVKELRYGLKFVPPEGIQGFDQLPKNVQSSFRKDPKYLPWYSSGIGFEVVRDTLRVQYTSSMWEGWKFTYELMDPRASLEDQIAKARAVASPIPDLRFGNDRRAFEGRMRRGSPVRIVFP